MSDYYSPDGEPIDYREWSRLWHDPSVKIVKQDTVCDGQFKVSTVYLGLDHSWGDGPPLIFETMVFTDGPLDEECWRYSTREDALRGHAAAIERCEFAYACTFGGMP